MNIKNISVFIFVALSFAIQAQEVAINQEGFTVEGIKLWDKKKVPFNKKDITLIETLDEVGIRYTQISDPVLYVYKKKEVTNNGPAVLFCPGGGYAKVTIGKNNGENTARRLLNMGFNVVAILKYRLPDPQIVNPQEKAPLCDAQKALSIIHRNAAKWSIDRNKIAVMGSSAGGHLAASLANLTDDILAPGVKPEEIEHAVSILLYPVISFNLPHRHKGSYKRLLGDKSNEKPLLDYYSMENQVSKNTPPTYVIHAADDAGVTYHNSLMYCDRLKLYGVLYKYVQLEKGGHGFGFNFKKTGVDWTISLEKWLREQTELIAN